ncbi:Hypothetical predicted protein, partial [Paramuricea clavata]
MITRQSRNDVEAQGEQTIAQNDIESTEANFKSLLRKLAYFNRSTADTLESEYGSDKINRQYTLLKTKLGEAYDLIQTSQENISVEQLQPKRAKVVDSDTPPAFIGSSRSDKYYAPAPEATISEELTSFLKSAFTKQLFKEVWTNVMEQYPDIKGTVDFLVSPIMQTGMKEDIKRVHGLSRTNDLFTFDEGLADKQAPFISVVRPLVSALQALGPTEVDVDGDEPAGPDPDHIKALIEDAIVLLGNAHCRLNIWRQKRFADDLILPDRNITTHSERIQTTTNPIGQNVETTQNAADYQLPTLKDIKPTDNLVAGRIKQFYSKWTLITSNPWMLSIVQGYKIPFVRQPIQWRQRQAKAKSKEGRSHITTPSERCSKSCTGGDKPIHFNTVHSETSVQGQANFQFKEFQSLCPISEVQDGRSGSSRTITAQHSKCDVRMVKRGCFKDTGATKANNNKRPLNEFLHNFKKKINWDAGWNNYLYETTC